MMYIIKLKLLVNKQLDCEQYAFRNMTFHILQCDSP